MRINTTQTTNCFAMVKLASRVICNYQNTLFQTSIVGVIFSACWCAEFDAGKHSLSEVGMTTDDICSHPKFKDNVINTLFWQFCRWQMIDLHSFVGLIHEFPVYMMFFFLIFFPMTRENHIIMLAAEVNMQMVPSRRRKWRPTNWPRLDLCNFYQRPIMIRKNEKNTKGAIFLQKIMHFDFDACRTCFHLLYSRESTRRWGLLQIKHVDREANVDQENALTRDGQVSPALCAANVGGVIQGSPGKGASQLSMEMYGIANDTQRPEQFGQSSHIWDTSLIHVVHVDPLSFGSESGNRGIPLLIPRFINVITVGQIMVM